ncbi:MAG TPA: PIN domain-containing protein [Gracilimonas sp.]|uniref:type II toxin-antitoxin system VapC family toxin n=1 Tax=Gracilimonas sp. TaxID=1974203 RepID=UPI002DA435A5|nr:PIN domain-containing protein [Gracilimonas sp.]
MNKYVADTMALILWLEKRKMPANVKKTFQQVDREQAEVIIPAMVFAELAYLSEKSRIDTTIDEAQHLIKNNSSVFEHPISLETVTHAFEIDDIPELHDRLIATSGKELGLPILTNDPDIQNSTFVKTIWD